MTLAVLGASHTPLMEDGVAGEDVRGDKANAAEERPGAELPHQADAAAVTRAGHQTHRTASVPLGLDLAL